MTTQKDINKRINNLLHVISKMRHDDIITSDMYCNMIDIASQKTSCTIETIKQFILENDTVETINVRCLDCKMCINVNGYNFCTKKGICKRLEVRQCIDTLENNDIDLDLPY